MDEAVRFWGKDKVPTRLERGCWENVPGPPVSRERGWRTLGTVCIVHWPFPHNQTPAMPRLQLQLYICKYTSSGQPIAVRHRTGSTTRLPRTSIDRERAQCGPLRRYSGIQFVCANKHTPFAGTLPRPSAGLVPFKTSVGIVLTDNRGQPEKRYLQLCSKDILNPSVQFIMTALSGSTCGICTMPR